MNVSLYQAAAAMNAHSRWQDVIAENLAASTVPGFKQQQISFESVSRGLQGSGEQGGIKTSTTTDFSPGLIRPTSSPTDLAIEGHGFFEVETPNGPAFTRDGEFRLNGEGQLVTKDGYPVVGTAGNVQKNPANPAPLMVSPSGDISQGTEVRGKIKVTEFSDPSKLIPISGGYFTATDPALVATPSKSGVRQGYLESSNTSVTMEMTNLIQAMRAFEANQKVIQKTDERMSRAISQLTPTP
jgi:flagellar basal-body rod protein FlgF